MCICCPSVASQQDLTATTCRAPVDILLSNADYTFKQAELLSFSLHVCGNMILATCVTIDISQYLFLGVVAGLLP